MFMIIYKIKHEMFFKRYGHPNLSSTSRTHWRIKYAWPKGQLIFSYFISSVILKLSWTSIQIVRVVVRLMILSFQFKHVARQRVINRMKNAKLFLTQLRYW